MKKTVFTAATLAILIGAIMWNGWVLGWLGHGFAGYSQMSISELEARGQPFAQVFNIFEYASGLLLAAGGIALLTARLRSVLLVTITLAIAAIGLLTIFDVYHPLDCNTYRDPVCVAKTNANDISQTDKLHNTESRISCYVTLILTVLITIWAYAKRLPRHTSAYALFVSLGILLSLVVLNYSSSAPLNAAAERVWNVLVSLDIVLICTHSKGLSLSLDAVRHPKKKLFAAH